MPLPFLALAGVSVVSSAITAIALIADDTVEEFTGEKSGINPLFLLLVILAAGFFYFRFIRK